MDPSTEDNTANDLLVIDRDPARAAATVRQLAAAGIGRAQLYEQHETAARVSRDHVRAVLLDCDYGTEALQDLPAQTPPILLTTGDAAHPHLARLAEVADEFLVWPCSNAELRLRVERCISRRGRHKAHRAVEARLRAQDSFNRAIVRSLSDMNCGVLVIEQRRLTHVNPAACALLGHSAETLMALDDFIDIFHPDERARIDANHRRRVTGEEFESLYETALMDRDGRRVEVDMSVGILPYKGFNGVVLLLRDIGERKRHRRELERLANYDSLTGLPNRRLFIDRLRQTLERSTRQGQPFAVVFADLDDFKEINDRHGHLIGDELIRQFGQRLAGAVRGSDTVARLGGDEFTLILEADPGTRLKPGEIADKLLRALAEPFAIAGGRMALGGSLGLTLSRGEPDTVDAIISRADSAMYRAKRRGGDRCCLALPEWVEQERSGELNQVDLSA